MRNRPMKRHAKAGETRVTWCGAALDDVLWTSEEDLVTCERCRAVLDEDARKKKPTC